MTRRSFWILAGGLGVATLGMAAWRADRPTTRHALTDPDDSDQRVRFVCTDNSGEYSPSIYLRVGGGQAAFRTVVEAAPYLRTGDQGASTAGLAGHLFRTLDFQGDTGGTMSIDPPPRPGPDGRVDWEAYAADCDIIVINVEARTARCCQGVLEGREIRDLPLGRRPGDRPGRRPEPPEVNPPGGR